MGFWLYNFFTISWFTHLTARIPALGLIRFDLLLVSILFVIAMLSPPDPEAPPEDNKAGRLILYILLFSLVTIPFVEWPGSVVKRGIPQFIKAVVFYFFTVKFIRTESQLKTFVVIFLAAQSFRVLEPLYLHVTQGYWGSAASMANWETLDRLSGSPYDVVNPNGLAFIVDMLLPFYLFLAPLRASSLVLSAVLVPAFIYALILTGSRSGFLGLLTICALTVYKSKHKLLLSLLFLVGLVFFSGQLSSDQLDRYLSIFSKNTKNAATAVGRFTVVQDDFRVAMRRPLFGHGLGTSKEANANFGIHDQPSHNLYVEILQEIGVIGLVLFLFYLKEVFRSFFKLNKLLQEEGIGISTYSKNLWTALQVFLGMNFLFSFASYGLSGPEWYLFPGLVQVLDTLNRKSA